MEAIVRLIGYLAVNDGHPGHRFEDFRLRDNHDVAIKNGEVGALAQLDRTDFVFLERGVGGPDSEEFQCLQTRQGLFVMPVITLEAGQIGPSHSGVEFDPWIALLNRSVRATGASGPPVMWTPDASMLCQA